MDFGFRSQLSFLWDFVACDFLTWLSVEHKPGFYNCDFVTSGWIKGLGFVVCVVFFKLSPEPGLFHSFLLRAAAAPWESCGSLGSNSKFKTNLKYFRSCVLKL